MNINHGKVSHPVEECKSCPDCIRVKEAFEQAKADGSLDKVLSPNNPFNLSGPLPKGYGITGASSSPTKPCCERCRYDQLDGDVICILENCECHKVYLVGCLCGRHTTPDITAPGTSHKVRRFNAEIAVPFMIDQPDIAELRSSPTKPLGASDYIDLDSMAKKTPKPSGNWEYKLEQAWANGDLESDFSNNISVEKVIEHFRSLLREKAGEIRGMKTKEEDIEPRGGMCVEFADGHDHGIEKAARIIES